ncbi:LOW QUALITY PROTEIN: uncharacterized protein LOC105649524, partial [Jatropha curcas]|uniref:LOW QUALITY PROTEIN: uncharacterized protein LOC105649524 n=1 Tax=Jatropha curcas TaxID=180498 RepID=UPI0018931BF2
ISAFSTPVYTGGLGFLANLPIGCPWSRSTFQKYHLETHHRFKRVDGIGYDHPSHAGSRFFHNDINIFPRNPLGHRLHKGERRSGRQKYYHIYDPRISPLEPGSSYMYIIGIRTIGATTARMKRKGVN